MLSVVGNRPQFIKSAPLSVALREHGIEEVVVHTGQHYDRELSQVFFEELSLAEPKHALGLRTSDPDAMRVPIARIVEAERPGWVLVYGDTNSTLAGAGAAAEAAVPLAHVEAGLRSGDLSMPEERNRIEVDRLAQLLLTPDERSSRILADEVSPVDARWLATSWPTRTGSWRRSRATVRASSTTSASNGAVTSSPRCIARRTSGPNA